jgi:hypothetical protein
MLTPTLFASLFLTAGLVSFAAQTRHGSRGLSVAGRHLGQFGGNLAGPFAHVLDDCRHARRMRALAAGRTLTLSPAPEAAFELPELPAVAADMMAPVVIVTPKPKRTRKPAVPAAKPVPVEPMFVKLPSGKYRQEKPTDAAGARYRKVMQGGRTRYEAV